jgi:hypothetical protein
VDELSDTERELRRLFRRFAEQPIPDPELSDEELIERIRAEATGQNTGKDDPTHHTEPRPGT